MTRARIRAASVLLAAAVVLTYLPALGNGFVDIDDQIYVVRNAHVDGLSWDNIRWAFTSLHGGQAYWHPLTWLSHALDRQLYGLSPRGHHLTSVLVHAASAVLLFGFLRALTGRSGRALAVAGLFALHPLRVESVAWVAERKDVLCALFSLVTLHAYLRYARGPSARAYAAVAGALVLALLSKPMAVTLPAVMLLMDAWPLARLGAATRRRALLEKVPLVALCLADAAVTVVAQSRTGAVRSFDAIGPAERAAGALVATGEYLWKLAWPAPGTLLPFYTHPNDLGRAIAPLQVVAAAAVFVAVSVAAWCWRRERPYLGFGWLWYLIMVSPVIGLVQVGGQRLADRYTYLPLVGPLMAVVWLVADLAGRVPGRERWLAGAAAAACAVLATLSVPQQRIWRDGVTLWEAAVRGEPESPVARLNLGNVLLEAGRRDEAIARTREAVALTPRYAPARAGLGVRLAEAGRYEDAAREMREAIALRPGDAFTRASLGGLLLAQGRTDEGIAELRAASELAPESAVVLSALARGLLGAGRLGAAIPLYERAVAIEPDAPPRRNDLAVAYLRAGRLQDGIAQLREAVRLNPSYRSGHQNLGLALQQAGDLEGARRHLEIAARLARPQS